MANFLSMVDPWDLVAQGYAETTSHLFEAYAEEAIRLAGVDANSHVLDVACGPGTLPRLIHSKVGQVKAIDFSQNMVDIFQELIKDTGIKNIEVICDDAHHLPYADESFDAVFSMFGLMFFPDRQQAYAEIMRTLKPGGRVIVSSWAPVADSPAMQLMFGAIRAINPEIPEPQTIIDSLENSDFFQSELKAAGFEQVTIHRITKVYPISTAEQLWSDLVKGSAPIAMMKKNSTEDEWQQKEKIAIEFLQQQLSTINEPLCADAWFGYGVKP